MRWSAALTHASTHRNLMQVSDADTTSRETQAKQVEHTQSLPVQSRALHPSKERTISCRSFSFSSSSSSAPQGYYSFSPLINCWSTLTETNWTNEGQLGSFLEALHLFRQSCSDENCDIVLLDPGLVTSVEVIPQIAPAIWKKYARGRAAVPLSGSRGRRIEFFGILGMGNSHWVTLMLQRLLMKGEGGEPDEVVLRAVILDPQERSHLSFPPRYRFEKMELEKRKIKCEHLVGLMKEELKKEWGSRFDLPLMLTYLPVGVQPLDDSRNCGLYCLRIIAAWLCRSKARVDGENVKFWKHPACTASSVTQFRSHLLSEEFKKKMQEMLDTGLWCSHCFLSPLLASFNEEERKKIRRCECLCHLNGSRLTGKLEFEDELENETEGSSEAVREATPERRHIPS
mmetsp:Transcript_14791/g.29872  ORF Transcript_14791/g.29872 Transcript_14791/m.29872 type:complete len:400 (-) Transcript_14791:136-1335(-)